MRIDSMDLMKTLEAFACRNDRREEKEVEEEEGATAMTKQQMSCPKAIADTVESLAAALFLDSDGDISRLAEVFLPHIFEGDKCQNVRRGNGACGGTNSGSSSTKGLTGDDPSQAELDSEVIFARLAEGFPGLQDLLEELENQLEVMRSDGDVGLGTSQDCDIIE